MNPTRIGPVAGKTFQRYRAFAGIFAAFAVAAIITGCVTVPDPQAQIIPATTNPRVAFQSQCAQNVVECTSSWPTVSASVAAMAGQTVTVTSNGYLVEETGGSGAVEVQFLGVSSEPGSTASDINYEWSYGASDTDPCTLAAGTVASTETNPELLLAEGFHYIRLTVQNQVLDAPIESDECGVISQDTGKFDFVELEVEVRRN